MRIKKLKIKNKVYLILNYKLVKNYLIINGIRLTKIKLNSTYLKYTSKIFLIKYYLKEKKMIGKKLMKA
jgi:hypothetical protein